MNIDTSKIEQTIRKLSKKDPVLFQALTNKIWQISNLDETGIKHLKNLKGELSHLKRVHVGSFVLTFQIKGENIIFENFVHHDWAYNR